MTFTRSELATIETALEHYALSLNKEMDRIEADEPSAYTLEELDDILWLVENIIESIDDEFWMLDLEDGMYEESQDIEGNEAWSIYDAMWDDIESYEEIEEDEYSVVS